MQQNLKLTDITDYIKNTSGTIQSLRNQNVKFTEITEYIPESKRKKSTPKETIIKKISDEIEIIEGSRNREGNLITNNIGVINNNLGGLIWTEKLGNQFGAVRGRKLSEQDNPENKPLYTAIFPNLKSGRQALEFRVNEIYQKSNGDMERFASLYAFDTEPSKLLTDRLIQVKDKYTETLLPIVGDKEKEETIKGRENDIGRAVISETNRIQNGGKIEEAGILNLDIFNPTRNKFEVNLDTLQKNNATENESTSVNILYDNGIDVDAYSKSIIQETDNAVIPEYISNYQEQLDITNAEDYLLKKEKTLRSASDDFLNIQSQKWRNVWRDNVSEAPIGSNNFKELTAAWWQDLGNNILGSIDFVRKAGDAFYDNGTITRVDESGKKLTATTEFQNYFASTFMAIPEIAIRIGKAFSPSYAVADPQGAKEAKDFIIQNPVTVALFGMGVKGLTNIKGFPKPPKDVDTFATQSTKIMETANEVAKGNIPADKVSFQTQQISNFIKDTAIIDESIKVAKTPNYSAKSPTLNKKVSAKIRAELPELLQTFIDNEVQIRKLPDNTPPNVINRYQNSKLKLASLIEDNLTAIGDEVVAKNLANDSAISIKNSKTIVQTIKDIAKGKEVQIIPDAVTNFLNKNFVRSSKNINKSLSKEYITSVEKLEKNNKNYLLNKIPISEKINKFRNFIGTSFDPAFKTASVLENQKKLKNLGGDEAFILAQEAMDRLRLSSGASSVAKNKMNQIDKEIFNKLSRRERELFDYAIIRKSNISLKEYYDNQKIPDLKARIKDTKDKSKLKQLKEELNNAENYNWESIGGINSTSRKAYSDFELDPVKGLGGDKKLIDKINNLSNKYFNTFRESIDLKYNSNLLTAKQRDALKIRDYSPIEFLEFVSEQYTSTPSRGKPLSLSNVGVTSLKKGGKDNYTRIQDSRTLLMNTIINEQNAIFTNNANIALADLIQYLNESAPDFAVSKIGKISKQNEKVPLGYSRISYKNNKGQDYFIDLESSFAEGWTTKSSFSNNKDISQWLSYVDLLALNKVRKFTATNADWAFAIKDTFRNIFFTTLKTHDAYSNVLPLAWKQMSSDIISVIPEVRKNIGYAKEYSDAGGYMDFLSMQGMFGNYTKANPKTFKKGVLYAQEKLTHINNLMEISSRVAYYKNLRLKGVPKTRAAAAARDIMDFNIKGNFMQALEVIKPYSNAGFLGARGAYRGFKDNPVSSISKYAQLGALSSSLYFLVNRNTPEKKDFYDNEISEYDKFNNFIISTNLDVIDENGKKRKLFHKIPKDMVQKSISGIFDTAAQVFIENKPYTQARHESIINSIKQLNPIDFELRGLPLGLKLLNGLILNNREIAGMNFTAEEKKVFKEKNDLRSMRTRKEDPVFQYFGDYFNISANDLQFTYDEITSRGNPIFAGVLDAVDAFLYSVDPETREKFSKEMTKSIGLPHKMPSRLINSFANDYVGFGREDLPDTEEINIRKEKSKIAAENTYLNRKAAEFAYLINKANKENNLEKKKIYQAQYENFLLSKDSDQIERLNNKYNQTFGIESVDYFKYIFDDIIALGSDDVDLRAQMYVTEFIGRNKYSKEEQVLAKNEALKIKGFASKRFKKEVNSMILEMKDGLGNVLKENLTDILFEE